MDASFVAAGSDVDFLWCGFVGIRRLAGNVGEVCCGGVWKPDGCVFAEKSNVDSMDFCFCEEAAESG